MSFSAHDYATHIFMFWDGFSADSKRAAGQIFCKSPQAGCLVVVQPGYAEEPSATLNFDRSIQLAEKIEQGIEVRLSGMTREERGRGGGGTLLLAWVTALHCVYCLRECLHAEIWEDADTGTCFAHFHLLRRMCLCRWRVAMITEWPTFTRSPSESFLNSQYLSRTLLIKSLQVQEPRDGSYLPRLPGSAALVSALWASAQWTFWLWKVSFDCLHADCHVDNNIQ